MKRVVLILGSNIGDTEYNISLAISNIESKIGKIIKKSKILKTLPVEFHSSHIFCNIAVVLQTEYSPVQLLDQLKDIEKEMGRENDSVIYGEYKDRIIDIDIVTYDEVIYSCKRLNIPHYKHLYKREFSKELLKQVE